MPAQLDLNNIPAVITFAVSQKLPEWQADYFKKIADAIQVHTRGFLFEKVNTLYPNEHPRSKEHCLSSYEPITTASIWKGINNISRIFSNSSYSVKTGEQSDEYVRSQIFDRNNLFSYFHSEWAKWAIAYDPNSLMIAYPPDYAEEKKINPLQFICYNYRLFLDDDMCIFLSERESEKTYAFSGRFYTRDVFFDPEINGPNMLTTSRRSYNPKLDVKITRKVLHVFTKDYFMILTEQDGGTWGFERRPYGKTLDTLPCFITGGVEIEYGIYNTFVYPFVPYGNLALIQHRQHTAVNLTFSFPRMSEVETVCGECTLGWVKCPVDEAHPDGRMHCTHCNGTGYTTNQSPYKTYKRRIDPNSVDNNAAADFDDVKYYTPDVAILDYSKEEWKNYLEMGEEAIFIQQRIETGNIPSAKSKEIDRDQQYAWLCNISHSLYGGIRNAVQAFENYLSASPVEVTVEEPYSFAILTEEEAFTALNDIINSKAPIFLKAQHVENFTSKFVSKTSPVVKALDILKEVDPFLYYSQEDMETFKANNAISTEQWQYHILSYPMLMQMYVKNKNLFDEERETIVTQLETAVKAAIPKVELTNRVIQPVQPQPAPQLQPTGNG